MSLPVSVRLMLCNHSHCRERMYRTDRMTGDLQVLSEPCTTIRRAGDYRLSLVDASLWMMHDVSPPFSKKNSPFIVGYRQESSNMGRVAKRKSTYLRWSRYHPLCNLLTFCNLTTSRASARLLVTIILRQTDHRSSWIPGCMLGNGQRDGAAS